MSAARKPGALSKQDRRIRKNDDVVVITGTAKGRQGKVLEVDRKHDRITVEGINRVWKHVRKSAEHPQGARLQREAPIHISNVRKIHRKKEKAEG